MPRTNQANYQIALAIVLLQRPCSVIFRRLWRRDTSLSTYCSHLHFLPLVLKTCGHLLHCLVSTRIVVHILASPTQNHFLPPFSQAFSTLCDIHRDSPPLSASATRTSPPDFRAAPLFHHSFQRPSVAEQLSCRSGTSFSKPPVQLRSI